MKLIKVAIAIIATFLSLPALAQPHAGVSLKARATGYYGTFGQTYSSVGYEPSLTIKPGAAPWAGGISFSRNILGYDANSDMKAGTSLLTFHVGATKAMGSYVHPFAYLLFGFRFMDYKSDDMSADDDPLFSSITLGYGARTGVQLGKGKWRFEGSVEYMSGTKARYLTPALFNEATTSGKEYRDVARRSVISGISASAGVAYVITWDSETIE
ncbi:hypothetical protein [Pontibacter fetidus]|uniref:Outer membrane protein beta-barrel domain-containing protein n=1 Tax=Pontibacter fetidus TaxID=2700082 RepID=A0A6B2GWM4_9BACT|nr:hypothetical protein [Pontibacter fetidus]NDK55329.1 hypothetical protein [Pontibacter fetidus]